MTEAPYTVKKIMTIIIIASLCALIGFAILPLFISIGLLAYVYYMLLHDKEFYRDEITKSKEENRLLQNQLAELDIETRRNEIAQLNKVIEELTDRKTEKENEYRNLIQEKQTTLNNIQKEIKTAVAAKSEKVESEAKKVSRLRELYKSIKYAIDNFINTDSLNTLSPTHEVELEKFDLLHPAVTLKLHTMDVKELRKAYRENDKQITKVLNEYSARYTTKSNQAIYSLMVIALRSELQNILTKLKYDKLDDCIKDIQAISQKYLTIASDGNQSIANTLKKFIGQIEYLFINATKIEYNYYVKKEKARQEQLALREKMREEAAERKALEAEKKKIEAEEAKYASEIEKVKAQMAEAASADMDLLNKRILELQEQLSGVLLKKNDIVNLQNGKAGTVYIISNLGSFGDDVFKIGMTRRMEPQDRINELGSASVPFKFDVHSFIFSEDAVALESKIHEQLTDRRVNKVNLRKEFFKISLDELENLVNEIDPTAEFNRTMIASEYRASLDSEECFIGNDDSLDFDDEELAFE